MAVDRGQFGNLDLGLLAALVALVEERSTVAAAQRLNLAQSTVAGQLARLRAALGDPLLVREGRVLTPTPRAMLLAERAGPHLEALAAVIAAEVPFDPSSDARVFRFGCTDGVALAILPALTARLRHEAPACDLVLRVGDFRSLPGMLQTGEVSTALAFLRDGPQAGAKLRVVRRSPWLVLRDPTTAPVADAADYARRPHALVTPTGDLTGVVDEGLQAEGLQRRVAVGVTSFALLPAVLTGTDMLATVPDFVASALGGKGLAVDPCPVEIPRVTNTLAWRMVADDDPAERWFRGVVMVAFQIRT
jgi:LysR family transcriptional regulator, mexEF-oprN operon transcriptional activator